MRLHLECSMGAAGDMLTAALLDLLPDKQAFLDKMNSLGLPGVAVESVVAEKCGVSGLHINVYVNGKNEFIEDFDPEKDESGRHHEHEHEHGPVHSRGHGHYCYSDICGLIASLDLPEKVRADALAVYRLIGDAEAEVHKEKIEQIHFHEVGSLDAVADVVGCCLLMDMLSPDSITASPVHVGSGFVRCSHGVLPVPAPATALLLRGIPIYGGGIKGELCTPTGAALLKHFVGRFGEMDTMTVSKIGYGMGTKDFEIANCVRAFWGEDAEKTDDITEISCNLDDMTPEAVGAVTELLFKRGALDVYAVPIYMKKNRPATLLSCLCRPGDRDELSRLILLHTSTFGVRFSSLSRRVLDCRFYTVDTKYGKIRVKSASGWGIVKEKPEYEDLLSAAKAHDVPFSEIYRSAVAAIENLKKSGAGD